MKRTLNHKNFWLFEVQSNYCNYLYATNNGEHITYLIDYDLSEKEIDEIIEKFNNDEIEPIEENITDYWDIYNELKRGTLWDKRTLA